MTYSLGNSRLSAASIENTFSINNYRRNGKYNVGLSLYRILSQSTTLQRTRANLAFLVNPSIAPAPESRRTRPFLRTARYTLKFISWRLARYAKYAAIGSLAALVAGLVIGSVASGAAFFIAPTGIVGGAVVGLLWGMGKFGWRRLAKKAGKRTGDARRNGKDDAQGEEIREVQERKEERGLRSGTR